MKRVAFLIGNGESRKGLDLEAFKGRGTVIGCNAIHREFIPDVLIAIDAKMLKEINNIKYPHYAICPANRKSGEVFNRVKFPSLNTSGGAAIHYAGICNFDIVFLIGYDCYTGNMFYGTEGYKTRVTNFSGFISHYKKAMQLYPGTKFCNVIRSGKDGISKYLEGLDNYIDAVDQMELMDNLYRFPSQKPYILHDHFVVKPDGRFNSLPEK